MIRNVSSFDTAYHLRNFLSLQFGLNKLLAFHVDLAYRKEDFENWTREFDFIRKIIFFSMGFDTKRPRKKKI